MGDDRNDGVQIAYTHGSGWKLPIGTELSAHKASLTRSSKGTMRLTEGLLELHRPPHCLSRYDSVFMTDTTNLDVIEASGGYANYVYRVEPEGMVERNHLGWWELINRHFHTTHEWDSAIQERLAGWARSYWDGIECPSDLRVKNKPSTWEYRARSVTVVEDVDPDPDRLKILPKAPAAVRRFLEQAQRELEATGSGPRP